MHLNTISIELGLPDLRVLDVREDEAHIEVLARYGREEAVCPRCERMTTRVHAWSRQLKRDVLVLGKKLRLQLWKRRFRCQNCGYTFTEVDSVCGPRRRTTRRLRRELAAQAQETTIKAVAVRQGVSEGLVQRSWLEASVPAPSLTTHTLIGLDGFSVKRPGRMWTGIWDFKTRQPVGFTPGQSQHDIERLLRQHLDPAGVKAVAMDLWRPNRKAVQAVLPQAVIVADKFHVVALAHSALQQVRARGKRLRAGTLPWLLHRNLESLRPEEQQVLARSLDQNPQLRQAWLLKEGLRSVYECSSLEQAQRRLAHWFRDAMACDLKPFHRVASTLRAWQQEILNYWLYRLTNAMVEGKHNRVKVLKRRAYGYRNDRNFMLRLLS